MKADSKQFKTTMQWSIITVERMYIPYKQNKYVKMPAQNLYKLI